MKNELRALELSEQEPPPKDAVLQELYNNFLQEMEVECQIRVGTLNIKLESLQEMRTGDVLSLQQTVQEPVELLFQNKVVARGELWLCEENYAIKIIQIGDS